MQQQRSKSRQSQSQRSQSQEESIGTQTQEDLRGRVKLNLDERRVLRQSYRQMISDVTNKKQELIQPESAKLDELLLESNNLFKHVQTPREGALDSELLTVLTQFSKDQAERLNLGFQSRDIGAFVTKVRALLGESEAEVDFDWISLGKRALNLTRRTPSLSNMMGPLGIEPVAPKERKKVVREKLAEKVRPEDVKNSSESIDQTDKETAKRVASLRNYLEREDKPNDFFHFIVNPQSFVKDGQASLKVKDGIPIVNPEQPPKEEDYQEGSSDRKQCVIKFDYDTWEKLKKGFDIKESYIKHNNNNINRAQSITTTSASSKPTKRKNASKSSKNEEQEEQEEEEEEEELSLRKNKKKTKKSKNS